MKLSVASLECNSADKQNLRARVNARVSNQDLKALKIRLAHFMVPTRTGKPGKMRILFLVREF